MILRVHNDQNADNSNTDGWSGSTALTEAQIAEIVDPQGGDASLDITSIPSPFGRWDLIRTAFRNVTDSGRFEGRTLDHKLVSDTLDVAQIFFHLDRLRKQGLVDLLCWDKEKEVTRLKESTELGHRELGKALSKYIAQDAASFNFDELESITLLRFIHPETGQKIIIGSTSPVTIFTVAPGDLSHIRAYISFGKDKPFDGDYCPLYKREPAFIVWLYALKASYPSFERHFKVLADYLVRIQSQLAPNIQKEINALSEQTYREDYAPQDYTAGNPISILQRLPLYASAGTDTNQIAKKSEFAIVSTRNLKVGAKAPLVLPAKPGYDKLFYVVDNWDKETKVPTSDPLPLEQRRLPASGEQYPYLCIGDFLEDTLILLKNEINRDNFYTGEVGAALASASRGGCLLPLKPLFFEYFSAKDLITRKMIELDAIGTDIVVKLTIPVRGGKIVYERNYSRYDADDLYTHQSGQYKSYSFELGMLKAKQHTHLCYVSDPSVDARLEAYDTEGHLIPEEYHVTQEVQSIGVSNIVELRDSMQTMRVTLGGVSAYIIPQIDAEPTNPSPAIVYAVDLGTTNTVVAFKDSQMPEFLSWKANDMLRMLTTFNRLLDGKTFIESRLVIPELGGECAFPLRSALRVNTGKEPYKGAFSNSSPDFTYQRISTPPTASFRETDIKWKGVNSKHLQAYVDSICKLIAMHAEHRGATSISVFWSYPSSMNSSSLRNLRSVWKSAFEDYIKSNKSFEATELGEENEAVAPYRYYSRTAGVQGHTVAMDIGGGTVDVLLTGFTAKDPMYLTSFRFGGNTLLLSPSNALSTGAGLCVALKDYLGTIAADQNPSVQWILEMMETLLASGESKEAAEYFFALEKMIANSGQQKSITVKLSDILNDDELPLIHFRSLILLYFVAQVYHIAKLTCALGTAVPDNFVFSGNGSRLLECLGDDDFLSRVITEIFIWVYNQAQVKTEYPIQIKAKHNDKPKESTTLGMLYTSNVQALRPERVVLAYSDRLVRDDETSAELPDGGDFATERDKTLADIQELALLLKALQKRLHLDSEEGYTSESLDLIAKSLADTKSNSNAFFSYVVPRIEEDKEISEGILFMLLSERLKQIGLDIYKELCCPR